MVIDMCEQCIESYGRLKNLKLVSIEVGIPWQTVYVHLKAAGVAVTGDKSRYGSATDRLAAMAEREFSKLVPDAIDQNDVQYQSNIDFIAFGLKIDVKASRLLRGRWAFSLKKQERVADVFVCFAYDKDGGYQTLVIPGDLCRFMQTISLTESKKGKWWDYAMNASEIRPFLIAISATGSAKAA